MLTAWLTAGGCNQRVPVEEPVWTGTWEDAQSQALELNRPILVIFTQPGCGPCVYLNEEVLPTQTFTEAASGRVVLAHLDVFDPDNEKLLQKYEIEFTPTLLLTDKSGTAMAYYDGGLNAEDLAEWLKEESTRTIHQAADLGGLQ